MATTVVFSNGVCITFTAMSSRTLLFDHVYGGDEKCAQFLGGESEWKSPSLRPRGIQNNLCKKGRGVYYSNIVQKYGSQVAFNS